MKFKLNKKYRNIAAVALMVIILSMAVFFIIFNLSGIKAFIDRLNTVLKPVTYGLIIAYLFTPIINFFERKVFFPLFLRKKETLSITPRLKKRFRVLSIILSMLIIYSFITIIIRSVIPQLGYSISRIATQFPVYQENLLDYADGILSRNPELSQSFDEFYGMFNERITSFIDDTLIPYMQEAIKNFSLGVFNAIKGLWSIVIGAIISIYVLYNKEVFSGQVKKVIYALLSKERANLFLKDARFVSDTFINFIVGKLIDSLIVGIVCFICCNIFKFPYPLLTSVIIGVTNMIPVFGPLLGAIPAAFIILMVDPVKCLYFIIFILVLQQIDGHILGPSILGEATGISGFWIIFAITVFGGLWGIVGMFIGIPFFAVIYALIRRFVDRRLDKKGLPTETYEYMPLKRIEENGDFTYLAEAKEDYYLKEREKKNRKKEEKRLSKKLEDEKNLLNQNLEGIIHHIKKDTVKEDKKEE